MNPVLLKGIRSRFEFEVRSEDYQMFWTHKVLRLSIWLTAKICRTNILSVYLANRRCRKALKKILRDYLEVTVDQIITEFRKS